LKETASRWILQEVFVDPSSGEEISEGKLRIKYSSELNRLSKSSFSAVVEIDASVESEERKIASLRFVSITSLSGSARRARSALKRVEERRISEFLALAPIYLVKAGITIKGFEVEL
jgi:hypothetical protein